MGVVGPRVLLVPGATCTHIYPHVSRREIGHGAARRDATAGRDDDATVGRSTRARAHAHVLSLGMCTIREWEFEFLPVVCFLLLKFSLVEAL